MFILIAEALGIIVAIIFFPRTVAAVAISLYIFHWNPLIIVVLALVAFLFDALVLTK